MFRIGRDPELLARLNRDLRQSHQPSRAAAGAGVAVLAGLTGMTPSPKVQSDTAWITRISAMRVSSALARESPRTVFGGLVLPAPEHVGVDA